MSKEKTTKETTKAVSGDETIKSLLQRIAKMKSGKLELEFQVSAVQDMSRIQITTDIVAALVARHGKIEKAYVSRAMKIAEMIMDEYKEIVDERKVQYREAVEKLEMEQATNMAIGPVQ